MIKLYAYIAIALAVIGATFGFWYTVHMKPLNELQALNTQQKDTIIIYENKINTLVTSLIVCEKKTEATEFQSYFEGGGGIEESNTSNTNNIFLKRMSK